MKIRFGIFVIVFFANVIQGQVVTSLPVYATQYDSIVVFFDATQGNQGMMGYTGNDVYAHTGVITNYSTSPSDWKHVIAPWNVNLPQCRLTRIATDLYELVIGYPRQYYNVTDPAEKILKLAFVFRNSNGSVTGRDVGGADIFLDLYDPGITTVIMQPTVNVLYGDPRRSPFFSSGNDTIVILATAATIGTQISSMKILVNQIMVSQVTTDTISYNFYSGNYNPGFQEIAVVSEDTAGIADTVSFLIMINPPVSEEPRPIGVHDGINYISNTTVTFFAFCSS